MVRQGNRDWHAEAFCFFFQIILGQATLFLNETARISARRGAYKLCFRFPLGRALFLDGGVIVEAIALFESRAAAHPCKIPRWRNALSHER